jgi:hypothetical protein
VWFWHPVSERSGLAPFEAWFWRETQSFQQRRTATALDKVSPELRAGVVQPELDVEWSALEGGLDLRGAVASALSLFALFFVCVYLLPSLMCEERERGVLLAQALSPAAPAEILAAKCLFYPVVGLALAALLAGLTAPAALLRPFFWLALTASAFGSLGIGLTISSLAGTQRAASMGALCYMLVVALLLFICQQNRIPGLPYLALEYHAPRMIHAALSSTVHWYHWGHVAGTALLAGGWLALATYLFRTRGWQ